MTKVRVRFKIPRDHAQLDRIGWPTLLVEGYGMFGMTWMAVGDMRGHRYGWVPVWIGFDLVFILVLWLSFSQMSWRKHGYPQWLLKVQGWQ